MAYEASLKQRRDAESVFNSALRSGHAKGKAEGRHEQAVESARKMLARGYKKEDVCDILDLTIEEIEKL